MKGKTSKGFLLVSALALAALGVTWGAISCGKGTECGLGAYKCDNNAAYTCVNSKWSLIQDCNATLGTTCEVDSITNIASCVGIGPFDGGTDAGADAATDGGGSDASTDAGETDGAITDAGEDAGVDAGGDAGCAPDCAGKCSGDDQCGGTCPNNCTGSDVCYNTACCTPLDCATKHCGESACGIACPPPACTATQYCDPASGCREKCEGKCLDMVTIPDGSFTMGCTIAEMFAGECDSDTLHSPLPNETVTFASSYTIDKYEVTVGDYNKCVVSGACSSITGTGCTLGTAGDDYPINCMSWDTALTYCQWVGKDLPSEAQWERAARGTTGYRKYPWASTPAPLCTHAVINDSDQDGGTGPGCGTNGPMLVGSKTSGETPEHVLDMAGNVFEWVKDDYHADYNGLPLDGRAWMEALPTEAGYVRGGGWANRINQGAPPTGVYFRTTTRDGMNDRHVTGDPHVGMRCASPIP